jgi:hypothetical protein
LTFPQALEFKNAALGLRPRVKLPRLSGYITLPRSNITVIGKPFAELLPPNIRQVPYAARVHHNTHNAGADEFLRWGKYFTWNKDNPRATARASRAVLCAGGVAVVAHRGSPLQHILQLVAETQPTTIVTLAPLEARAHLHGRWEHPRIERTVVGAAPRRTSRTDT